MDVPRRPRGRPRKLCSTTCATCGQQFSKIEHLQRHERRHTGERPFECSQCGKRFSRKDVLSHHIQNHTRSMQKSGRTSSVPEPPGRRHERLSKTGGDGQESRGQHLPPRNSPQVEVEVASADPVHFSLAHVDRSRQGAGNMAAVLPSNSLALQQDYYADGSAVSVDFYPAVDVGFPGMAPWESEGNDDFWFDLANNHQTSDLFWNTAEPAAVDTTFPSPWLSLPGPACRLLANSQEKCPSRERMPDELFDKVHQCWPATKTDVPTGNRLWDQIIAHSEDDIFSQRILNNRVVCAEPFAASRWKFDESCRWRIIRCLKGVRPEGCLETSQYRSTNVANTSGQELRYDIISQDGRNGNCGASTKFPSISTLDFGLDLFFDQLHPFVPVIHVPTFDARKTPDVLLLALCMAGFVKLKGPAAQQFLEENLMVLVARCRQELKAATSKTTPLSILAILASSYLAVLSALLTGKSNAESCRRLQGETVSVMIAHGFFGNDIVSTTESGISDEDLVRRYGWKVWARVESIKRLIIAVVMVDAFYSNTLDLNPTIPTQMLNLYLPCDEKLFVAPSESEWRRILLAGNRISSATLAFHADQVLLSPQWYYPGSLGLHGVLAAVWIRLSEAHHRLLSRSGLLGHGWGLIPYEVYSTDHSAKSIAPFLVNFMQLHGGTLQNANPHALIMWNILCVMLLSNSWMFELGVGQKGAEPARAALAYISSWADTLAARRACVHAAQIFWICSKGKISDRMMLHSETSLFLSALVLGLYVLVMKADTGSSTRENNYELLADLDWRDLGDVALGGSPYRGVGMDLSPEADFIANRGALTFDGIPLSGGYASARRILVHFANLLEDVGMWRSSDVCRVLHIIGDALTEDEVDNRTNDPVAFQTY